MSRGWKVPGARRLKAIALAGVLALTGVLPASMTLARQAHAANDTLYIGWPLAPQTFDPPGAPDNPSIWVLVNIYDQLLRTANDGVTLQPDLATSWDVSKDGTIYTFHLRHGVTFHNGAPLTAADVKFTLDRARNPSEEWSFILGAIKHVDVVDTYTLKVTLLYPWAPFLSDVAFFGSGVYPEAYFKKVGAKYMAQHPIGTGPYMLEAYKNGSMTRLKKNPNYFLASRFPMQHVEFDVIPSDSTRLLEVESGQLDVDNVLAPNLVTAINTSQNAKAQVLPSTKITYLQPSHKVAPFGDVNVRQAINHAIDRAAIIKAVYKGYATPANSFMAKGAIDWDPNLKSPSFDLALARQYLAKSSVPHGFNMILDLGAGNLEQQQISVIFQAEMKQIGINVTIKTMDPTTLSNDNLNMKFSMINQYWTNDIPDPDELVAYAVDYSNASVRSYLTQYDNPTLVKLVHEGESTRDPAARKAIYYQIQQIFAQQVPFFYLTYTPFINGVNNHAHGFGQNPLGYFVLQGVTKS
ncbi:MAG TPA: ABC transporter substrate-binding protein [Chloroflexota bacterium]|nr:ABC transporter substrate-binding protein [Chloroflexota bacterium]